MDGFQRGYELENEMGRAVSWLDFSSYLNGRDAVLFLIHFSVVGISYIPSSQWHKRDSLYVCMICRLLPKVRQAVIPSV